jgi:hypothetical protein
MGRVDAGGINAHAGPEVDAPIAWLRHIAAGTAASTSNGGRSKLMDAINKTFGREYFELKGFSSRFLVSKPPRVK